MLLSRYLPTLAALVSLRCPVSGATTCLSCKDVVKPRDCSTITRCGANSECYGDSYVTPLGFIRYNLGCRDKTQCLQPSTGKRSAGNHMLCSACCAGNLCNSAACHQTGIPARPLRGPVCFNCPSELRPDSCSDIHICGRDEVCFIKEDVYGINNELRYTSKCEPKTTCDSQLQLYGAGQSHSVIIGNKCIMACCDTDLCNTGCNVSATTVVDHCSNNPCQQGNCITNSASYTCSCYQGYTGTHCDQAVDYCSPSPCVHGTCQKQSGGYTCSCFNGYTGTKCDHAVDYCSPNPCVHGTCHGQSGGYMCSCYNGYIGTNCDHAFNHCASNPCVHGTCKSSTTGYSCTCNTGFAGSQCGQAVDYCSPNQCVHGTCHGQSGGYTCSCYNGYIGTNCDQAFNHCASNPCVHGTCKSSTTGYSCTCNTGFAGSQCGQVLNHCSSNPCVHGTCQSQTGSYICSCNLGYTGINCDRAIDHCANKPCIHGTCSNQASGFTCACTSGYTGMQCDKGGGCPSGWEYHDAHCYLFDMNRRNFHDAVVYCIQQKGRLLHIDSSEEQAYIRSKLTHLTQVPYWLGIQFKGHEGDWRFYDTHSTLTFTAWAPGEPNQPSGADITKCAVLSVRNGNDFRWEDIQCELVYPRTICEIDLRGTNPLFG